FSNNLLGTLVLAQSAEGCVSDDAIGRPCAKLNLRHELWFDIASLIGILGRDPCCEGTLGNARLLEFLEEIRRHPVIETGADSAGIDEILLVIIAQHQGADGFRRGGRWDITCNDEFLPPGAFGLDPVLAATRAIGGIAILGYDAFEAQPAGMAENEFAVLLEMVAEAQDRRGILKECLQGSLAADQR